MKSIIHAINKRQNLLRYFLHKPGIAPAFRIDSEGRLLRFANKCKNRPLSCFLI